MSEITGFISNIPNWIWVVLVLVVFFAKTGKVYKKLWDYEVEFSLKDGIGWGEVDFECRERDNIVETKICVKLRLDEMYQNKDVEIYLNNAFVHTHPKEKNVGSRAGCNSPIDMEEPNVGDIVSVRIDGTELFSGPLALD